jgi:XRE family aerobic/anaerobic benzoate catabolism transcriptional regulator
MDMHTPAFGAPDREAPDQAQSEAFLKRLGEHVRLLRARRGMTRNTLASAAGVSLRYLADLEAGRANASVLLLRQVALALNAPIEEIVSPGDAQSSEFVLLAHALRGLPDARLRLARAALAEFLHPKAQPLRTQRIALIGLRGAGKSTIGRALAARLDVPFVELSKEIEANAGLSVGEIHGLYGQTGYRRYERDCLENVIATYPALVLSAPGSLVAEADTYNLLLGHCLTIWLKASPEEHMARVVAQGDLRPMAGQSEAMADLKRILDGREPFYRQADLTLNTSGASAAESVDALVTMVRQVRARKAVTED